MCLVEDVKEQLFTSKLSSAASCCFKFLTGVYVKLTFDFTRILLNLCVDILLLFSEVILTAAMQQ